MNRNTGDIIVGDCDGLVVVEQDRVEEAIRLSRSRENKEDGIPAGLEAGKSTMDSLGLGPTLEKLGRR
ncbi:RraA family protein [Pseudomonas sp.]|uniref:hypothetical protein n=1 Tax=Pseudomonas sp. TaxID=306 RepID=UPI003C5CA88A